MKKTTGTISFIGGIVALVLLIYLLIDKLDYLDGDEVLVFLGFLLVCSSVIHYTLVTKFWASKITVIESLERENQIIRKQIEKKELLVKLQDLEEK